MRNERIVLHDQYTKVCFYLNYVAHLSVICLVLLRTFNFVTVEVEKYPEISSN